MELGAEVNIRCRSPQVGAEIIPCRSYSCRTSIAPYGEVTGVQFEVKQVSKCVWLLLMVPCLDSIFPDSILTYSKERFIFLDVMHFYAELILKPFKAYAIFALVFYHIQHNHHCYLLANCILVAADDCELWYNYIDPAMDNEFYHIFNPLIINITISKFSE